MNCKITPDCTFKFTRKKELIRHILLKHPDTKNLARRGDEVHAFDGQLCVATSHCRYIGQTDEEMIEHLRKMHGITECKKEGFKWSGQ